MSVGFGKAGPGRGRNKDKGKIGVCAGQVSWRLCHLAAGISCSLMAAAVPGSVGAQMPITSNGPPPEVIPQVGELGMPNFTIPNGTSNPFTGSSSGSVTDDGSSGGGNLSGSDVLNTMISQPWGIAAINNAQALGVNPSALAATCVIESGCQNSVLSSASSAAGAFQMMPATYYSSLNAALAQNPGLASTIVSGAAGMTDPATESIAASEYLLQAAQTLQANGISSPTVLDVRGYYNFGPVNGANLANAQDSDLMGNVLAGISASTLAANGITPGETVGQWRASVAAKVGNAAGQPVLNS